MESVTWVQGETKARRFTLLEDGAPIDLTGCTVSVSASGSGGAAVDFAGDVSVVTPASGLVAVYPDAGDLLASASPLKVRFRIVDVGGLVAYCPNGEPMSWAVQAV